MARNISLEFNLAERNIQRNFFFSCLKQLNKSCKWRTFYNLKHSPFSPWRNLCQIRSSVEEVEDNDSHNDGYCCHGHHKGQVDSCKKTYYFYGHKLDLGNFICVGNCTLQSRDLCFYKKKKNRNLIKDMLGLFLAIIGRI